MRNLQSDEAQLSIDVFPRPEFKSKLTCRSFSTQPSYVRKDCSMDFDWHGSTITRHTVIDANYRNTQNVRRFLLAQCGQKFKLDREFMAWIGDGAVKNMGDVADEWMRRYNQAGDA